MSPEAAIATFSEPEVGLVPLHAPEALHVDAFVVVQVKVVSAPIATLMGLAVRLTVAGGVGGGVGSEEPPPPPPQAVKIIIDRYSGRSKGFGFIEMNNNDEAKAAMEALSGKELSGRTLVINEARARQ